MCITLIFVFFKQKTAYEMRISDWSSDVCSSDLVRNSVPNGPSHVEVGAGQGSVSRAQCTFVAKNLGPAKEECIDIGADRRHGVRYEHQFVGTLRAESGPQDRKSTSLNSSH